MQKTNSELATEQKTTSRQISKSRKRGYILRNDGVKVRFTAPKPAFVTTNPTGHKSRGGKWCHKQNIINMAILIVIGNEGLISKTFNVGIE